MSVEPGPKAPAGIEIVDAEAAKKALAHFVASCRREWPGFQYVAAPEPQQRGAWHWHVAVRGFVNYDKLRGFWWKALGEKVRWDEDGKPCLHVGGEWTCKPGEATPGNVHGKPPGRATRGKRRDVWNCDRLASYIGKYVAKGVGDDAKLTGASYSASRGIVYRIERFVVRACGLDAVATSFFDVLAQQGLTRPHVWLSEDRSVWWAAGRIGPPR